MNEWCDFGFEIEMPAWLFLLLIILFLSAVILWFILDLKLIKLRREEANRSKPKKDLQKLLNKLNDRIYDVAKYNATHNNPDAQERERTFIDVKYMILEIMDKEEKGGNDKC